MFTVFIILIIFEIFLALLFSRTASLIMDSSKDNSVKVFGRLYNSTLELYMDFNFLNELFDGQSISKISNEELRINLAKMRKILIAQIVAGISFVIMGMILGITKW